MKIWSWKSAAVLWIFSWVWLSVFDVYLPRAVNFNTFYIEYQEEQEVLVEQEEHAKYVFRQQHFEEMQALYYKSLGMPL